MNPCNTVGKVALVAGGNTGIGLGFARGVAKSGGDIVIWGRRPKRNEEAAAQLRDYGTEVFTDSVDVSSEMAVVEGITKAVRHMGRIDCVFANAGFADPVSNFRELTDEQFRKLLDTNLHGAFYVLREAAKHMVERAQKGDPGGSLVICGSSSVFRGTPSMPHYAAAKGALVSMMRTITLDVGPHGIRANMIIPGYIVTEMTSGNPHLDRDKAQQVEAMMLERTPIARNGFPEDFEGIGAYLTSDASSFLTGATIVIDGGRAVA